VNSFFSNSISILRFLPPGKKLYLRSTAQNQKISRSEIFVNIEYLLITILIYKLIDQKKTYGT